MKLKRIALSAIALAVLSGCAESGFGNKYTATAILRIHWQEPSIATQAEGHTPISKDQYQAYKETQRQLVKSRFVLLTALRNRDVAKLASVQEAQKSGGIVRWLASMVKVDFPGDTEIMSVSVTRDDPREAAKLVQAIVDAYMSDIVDSERNQKRVRLTELDRAYIEKETDLRAKREELKKLADTLGTVEKETLSLKQGVALEEWKELRKDLRLIQAELRALKKELAIKKSALSDAKEPQRDPILKQIKQVEANIAATTEQENEVKKQVEQSLKEVTRLGSSVVDIDMMQNDIKNLDDILAGIAKERERLRIEIRAMSRVTLLERAEVPEIPD